jgi:uncharacterized membrane protein
MNSRLKVAGHAVHPMLIPIPLGMFIGTLVFDLIYLITDDPQYATVSFFMIATAVVGGVLAIATGAVDYGGIPKGTRAKRVATVHAIGNDIVVALFAVSWLLRLGPDDHEPSALALILTFVGAALSFLTGWLGGELVERLGVGVDDDAHLDASSSLKDGPLVRMQLGDTGSTEARPGR